MYTLLVFCSLLSWVLCQNWQLIWEDNFDGTSIDLSNWDHEITAWGGGNSEFQVYTDDPANSYVSNGLLYIKPTLLINNINPLTGQPFGEGFQYGGILDLYAMYGRCTMEWENSGCYRVGFDMSGFKIPPIMSARLRTMTKFSFRYGRAEIRAKMPVGDWKWPAMWLLPENYVYGGWPRSGEMDMIEIIGNREFWRGTSDNRDYAGIQSMGTTMHWGQSGDQNKYYLTHNTRKDVANNYGDNFHIYVVEWSPNGLKYFVDGSEILTIPNPPIDQNPGWSGFWTYGAPWNNPNDNPWASGTLMAPFDENFHFLLNVAVGTTGGFIPDGVTNWNGEAHLQKPWNNADGYELGMRKLWDNRFNWLWTWDQEGDNQAMQVDYVRVFQDVGQQ